VIKQKTYINKVFNHQVIKAYRQVRIMEEWNLRLLLGIKNKKD
jgi:hypothetical protein